MSSPDRASRRPQAHADFVIRAAFLRGLAVSLLCLCGCEVERRVSSSEPSDARASVSPQELDGSGFVEAPDGGASVDASRVEDGGSTPLVVDGAAVSGPLVLALRRDDAGVGGMRVWFHDQRGELVAQGTTDGAGEARGTSSATMLTIELPALDDATGPTTFVTYTGLSGAVPLRVELPESKTIVGRYDVTWPAPGQPYLKVQIGGCIGDTPWSESKPLRHEQVAMTRACVDRARGALAVAEGDNDMGHSVEGFYSAEQLPPLREGGAAIELSKQHEVSYLEVTTKPPTYHPSGVGMIQGSFYRLPTRTAPRTLPHAIAFPAGLLESLVVTVTQHDPYEIGAPTTMLRLARDVDPKAGKLEIDLQQQPGELGKLVDVRLRTDRGPRPVITWQSIGDVTSADFGTARLDWSSDPSRRWLIAFPADAQEVLVPALPPDVVPSSLPRIRHLTFMQSGILRGHTHFTLTPMRLPGDLWSRDNAYFMDFELHGSLDTYVATEWHEGLNADGKPVIP